MTDQYLALHKLNLHGIVSDGVLLTPLPSDSALWYYIDFPDPKIPVPCPVPDCPAIPTSRDKMRRHFAWRHPANIIVIKQEGLFSRCPHCGIFLKCITAKHLSSLECRRLTACCRKRHYVPVQRAASLVVFHANNQIIENVPVFKYLGRYLERNDLDDSAIRARIMVARSTWGRMFRVLSANGGVRSKTMGRFYLAVIQQILLHGSESWIISPTSQRLLESFHHRCARYMAHRHIRRCTDGSWEHPDTAHVLMCCGLSPIMTYIAQRKTRLLNHYAMPSSALYSQCLASHPFVSSAVHRQVWWTTPVDISNP